MDPEDPDSVGNHTQNVITSSFYHFGHILKILSKSVHKFWSYLVHKQTDKPRKHNLLGGGKDHLLPDKNHSQISQLPSRSLSN